MQQTSTTYLSGISTDEGQANIRGQDPNRRQQAPDSVEPIVEGIHHQISDIEKGRGPRRRATARLATAQRSVCSSLAAFALLAAMVTS